MKRIGALIPGLLLGLLSALPAQATSTDDVLLDAMEAELSRSVERLALEDYDRPYFVSYVLREREVVRRTGRFGALSSATDSLARTIFVEVRVGSPELDNTSVDPMKLERTEMGSAYGFRSGPLDDDPVALRSNLWRLTDAAYKDALAQLSAKRGQRVFEVDPDEEVLDFAPRGPARASEPDRPFEVDVHRWEEVIRRETAALRRLPELTDGSLSLDFRRVRRRIVQSDGTRISTEDRYFALWARAFAVADDGMQLGSDRTFYRRAREELPTDEEIHREMQEMAAEVIALKRAPVQPPFTGPAVLDPSGAGVFFHEALGHRLEGERQRSKKSGQTFTAKLGEPVLPAFLTVTDDPGLARTDEGVGLYGHYRFDDEGTPAERALLVEDGVLRGYLMSRTPVAGADRSNGHGRSDGERDPVGRMANLIVQAKDGETVPRDRLVELLREEAERRGKPYGLLFRHVTSGETNTARARFQAFRANPRLVYRVDAETGEQTLVRGVEIVGTPLAAISRIVAATSETGIFNGYCGAESGFIPVTEIAPWVLVEEIEVQRTTDPFRRPPILPPPAFELSAGASR